MGDLPSGTVTFLFTDIEGSTALWERDRAAMAAAVARPRFSCGRTSASRMAFCSRSLCCRSRGRPDVLQRSGAALGAPSGSQAATRDARAHA
ncbi:MAG: hypothetical protein K0R44_436 [Thermomicrobiales bacterium]|nr:hypothetical protein [Thermomicrobiales bacterium]